MFKNTADLKARHDKFVAETSTNGRVWALENKEGFATSGSNQFEDEEGGAIKLICFWSDEKWARVCARESWSSYLPIEISLEDFLENWCIGMHSEGTLVGTNFDWNMFGTEIEPLELIIEIAESLKKKGIELNFRKFDGLEDLKTEVNLVLKSLE